MVLQRKSSDTLVSFESVDTYTPCVFLYPKESAHPSTIPCVNSEDKMSQSVQGKFGGTEGHDDTPTQENMMLRKKIRNIEMQNQSQQQRLLQLEKLVLELQGFISVTSTSTKHPLQQSGVESSLHETVHNSGIDTGSNKNGVEELKDLCEMEDRKLLTTTEEERESSEVGSQDMASLMDEFDRKARETGLLYGMTPCYSTAESDDLADASKLLAPSPDRPTLFSSVSESPDDIVCSAPSPAFITPVYQNNTENLNPIYREPEIVPQLSFTTPSLLTVEALKDIEVHHTKSLDECANNLHPIVGNTQNEPSCSLVKTLLTDRGSPFSNLIAGIRQQMPVPQSKKSITGRGIWPVRSAQYRSSEQKGSGMCSPAGNVGSTSEAILRWSQSLRLPFLSPLTESHCSDQPLVS